MPKSRSKPGTSPATRVSYELTDLGLSLHQAMQAVKSWAKAHMDEVLLNRDEYDARSA